MKKLLLTILLILAMVSVVEAATYRSKTERLKFVRSHQCPATNLFKLPCPGYVIDHIIPLCAGGPDKFTNMQWQDLKSSYIKDAQERKQCKAIKK